MNNERLTNHEQHNANQEALDKISQERQEKIRDNLEKGLENNQEKNVEEARQEVLERLKETQESSTTETNKKSGIEKTKEEIISKSQKEQSYKKTMSDIRQNLSPTSRAYSKLIHNKVIEKPSEAIGQTIARPNAILSGAIFAFIITTVVLVIARYYGYPLSGFESIGSFLLGWIIGVVIDFLKTMIQGR